jgi:cytochrome P450
MTATPPGQPIPGPPPMPLLGTRGNFLAFIRNPIRYMVRLNDAYGGIASLSHGNSEHMFVFTPELNRKLLSDVELFHNLEAASSPLRMPEDSSLTRLFSGLTNLNGAHHARQRRLIAPTFHRKRIDAYRNEIAAITDQKIDGWRSGEQRDLYREMRELTLSIAVKALLGLDLDQGGSRMCHLLERWRVMVFSIPGMLFPFQVPGSPYWKLIRLSRRLESEIKQLIERKRADTVDDSDVLSTLLRARDRDGAGLTDEELIGQTNFLFMAGHVTTASALTWAVMLLACHPRVLGSLLDELEDKSVEEIAIPDQAARLPLLEGVIKETLRLLPPVTWWSRVCTRPATLSSYAVPEGARVVYSPYITHRLPDLYPMPGRFLPGRWLHIDPGPYEYLPFSAGPRMCLGSGFAMMEMRLVLATLLRRYHLTIPPNARIDPGGMLLLEPKQGLPVIIRTQDRRVERSSLNGTVRTMIDLD